MSKRIISDKNLADKKKYKIPFYSKSKKGLSGVLLAGFLASSSSLGGSTVPTSLARLSDFLKSNSIFSGKDPQNGKFTRNDDSNNLQKKPFLDTDDIFSYKKPLSQKLTDFSSPNAILTPNLSLSQLTKPIEPLSINRGSKPSETIDEGNVLVSNSGPETESIDLIDPVHKKKLPKPPTLSPDLLSEDEEMAEINLPVDTNLLTPPQVTISQPQAHNPIVADLDPLPNRVAAQGEVIEHVTVAVAQPQAQAPNPITSALDPLPNRVAAQGEVVDHVTVAVAQPQVQAPNPIVAALDPLPNRVTAQGEVVDHVTVAVAQPQAQAPNPIAAALDPLPNRVAAQGEVIDHVTVAVAHPQAQAPNPITAALDPLPNRVVAQGEVVDHVTVAVAQPQAQAPNPIAAALDPLPNRVAAQGEVVDHVTVAVAHPQAQAPNPIAAALDPLPNRVAAQGEVIDHVTVAVAQPQAQAPNPITAALDPLPNRVVAQGEVVDHVTVAVAQPQAQAPNPIAAALDPLPNRVAAQGEVVDHVTVAVAQPQAQAPNPIAAALDPLPNRVAAQGEVIDHVTVAVAHPQAQAPNPITAALDPLPNRVVAQGEVVDHVTVAVAQPQAQAPNPIAAALDPLPNRVAAQGEVVDHVTVAVAHPQAQAPNPIAAALDPLPNHVAAQGEVVDHVTVAVAHPQGQIPNPITAALDPLPNRVAAQGEVSEVVEDTVTLTSNVQMVRTPVKAKQNQVNVNVNVVESPEKIKTSTFQQSILESSAHGAVLGQMAQDAATTLDNLFNFNDLDSPDAKVRAVNYAIQSNIEDPLASSLNFENAPNGNSQKPKNIKDGLSPVKPIYKDLEFSPIVAPSKIDDSILHYLRLLPLSFEAKPAIVPQNLSFEQEIDQMVKQHEDKVHQEDLNQRVQEIANEAQKDFEKLLETLDKRNSGGHDVVAAFEAAYASKPASEKVIMPKPLAASGIMINQNVVSDVVADVFNYNSDLSKDLIEILNNHPMSEADEARIDETNSFDTVLPLLNTEDDEDKYEFIVNFYQRNSNVDVDMVRDMAREFRTDTWNDLRLLTDDELINHFYPKSDLNDSVQGDAADQHDDQQVAQGSLDLSSDQGAGSDIVADVFNYNSDLSKDLIEILNNHPMSEADEARIDETNSFDTVLPLLNTEDDEDKYEFIVNFYQRNSNVDVDMVRDMAHEFKTDTWNDLRLLTDDELIKYFYPKSDSDDSVQGDAADQHDDQQVAQRSLDLSSNQGAGSNIVANVFNYNSDLSKDIIEILNGKAMSLKSEARLDKKNSLDAALHRLRNKKNRNKYEFIINFYQRNLDVDVDMVRDMAREFKTDTWNDLRLLTDDELINHFYPKSDLNDSVQGDAADQHDDQQVAQGSPSSSSVNQDHDFIAKYYDALFPNFSEKLKQLTAITQKIMEDFMAEAKKSITPTKIIFGHLIRDEDEDYIIYDKSLQPAHLANNAIDDGEHLDGNRYMIPYSGNALSTMPNGALIMAVIQNDRMDHALEPKVKTEVLLNPLEEVEIIGRHYKINHKSFVVYEEHSNGFLNVGNKFDLGDKQFQSKNRFSMIPYDHEIVVKDGVNMTVENLAERDWIRLKMDYQKPQENDDGPRGYKIKSVEHISTQDLHGKDYKKFIDRTYEEARQHNFGKILSGDNNDQNPVIVSRSSAVPKLNPDDDI